MGGLWNNSAQDIFSWSLDRPVTMEGSALGNTHNLYTSLIVNFKYWNSDFLQESCIPRIANRQNVSERSAVLWYTQLNDRITKQMNYYKSCITFLINDLKTKGIGFIYIYIFTGYLFLISLKLDFRNNLSRRLFRENCVFLSS